MTKQTKALAIPDTAAIVAEYKATGASPLLLDLITAADTGDEHAIAGLREVYRSEPELAMTVSGWQWLVEREIIGTTQPGVRETFAAQADQLRRRLRGDGSTPLENVLINRIVVDHLHALKVEHKLHQTLNSPSLPIAQAEYHHRQAERAQRRVVRSLKALAEIRRLLTPAMQINLAEQQIVAGTVHTGERKPAA